MGPSAEQRIESLLHAPASGSSLCALLEALSSASDVAGRLQQLLPFVVQKLASAHIERRIENLDGWRVWLRKHCTAPTLLKIAALLLAQAKDEQDEWLVWALSFLSEAVERPAFFLDFWHNAAASVCSAQSQAHYPQEPEPSRLSSWQQWLMTFLFGLPLKLSNRRLGVYFLDEESLFRCVQRSMLCFLHHMFAAKESQAEERQAMALLFAKLCRLGKTELVATALLQFFRREARQLTWTMELVGSCSPLYQRQIQSSLFLVISQKKGGSFDSFYNSYHALLQEVLLGDLSPQRLDDTCALARRFASREARLAFVFSLLTHGSRSASWLGALWCHAISAWRHALQSLASSPLSSVLFDGLLDTSCQLLFVLLYLAKHAWLAMLPCGPILEAISRGMASLDEQVRGVVMFIAEKYAQSQGPEGATLSFGVAWQSHVWAATMLKTETMARELFELPVPRQLAPHEQSDSKNDTLEWSDNENTGDTKRDADAGAFEPFEPTEESLPSLKPAGYQRPRYIRDTMLDLTRYSQASDASYDMEKLCHALAVLPGQIESGSLLTLQEIGPSLMRILLHLPVEDHMVPGKTECLLSLLFKCHDMAITELLREFYSTNLVISQRLEILVLFAQAANGQKKVVTPKSKSLHEAFQALCLKPQAAARTAQLASRLASITDFTQLAPKLFFRTLGPVSTLKTVVSAHFYDMVLEKLIHCLTVVLHCAVPCVEWPAMASHMLAFLVAVSDEGSSRLALRPSILRSMYIILGTCQECITSRDIWWEWTPLLAKVESYLAKEDQQTHGQSDSMEIQWRLDSLAILNAQFARLLMG